MPFVFASCSSKLCAWKRAIRDEIKVLPILCSSNNSSCNIDQNVKPKIVYLIWFHFVRLNSCVLFSVLFPNAVAHSSISTGEIVSVLYLLGRPMHFARAAVVASFRIFASQILYTRSNEMSRNQSMRVNKNELRCPQFVANKCDPFPRAQCRNKIKDFCRLSGIRSDFRAKSTATPIDTDF